MEFPSKPIHNFNKLHLRLIWDNLCHYITVWKQSQVQETNSFKDFYCLSKDLNFVSTAHLSAPYS